MILCKTKAALASIRNYRKTGDHAQAARLYDDTTAGAIESNSGDDILNTFFNRLERDADLWRAGFQSDEPRVQVKAADTLLNCIASYFRLIRSLKGGCLPLDELYQVEVDAGDLRL